ncbi:hypothetical protein J4463_02440 [Candidatus Pacearchaeota archaeon]|nr:hypothetical protein [Candidatus Pacearchaeota archaeon]
MKSKEWVGVIAVVVIIAVVMSLITAGITGDVIRVKKATTGAYVYTKADIDAKLRDISGFPKNCNGNSFVSVAAQNGTAYCRENLHNKCLISEVTLTLVNSTAEQLMYVEHHYIPCNNNFEDYIDDDENPPGTATLTRVEVICCD